MKKLFGLGKGLSSLIPRDSSTPAGATQKESVFLVETGKIQSNPDQPRKEFDDEALKDLSRSIRKYGILQPLLVSKVETESFKGMDVSYELIAGERRLRAAKLAGIPRVPVIIRDELQSEPKSNRLELALIENLQREDLNSMEEAEAFSRLSKEFNLTQKEIAEKVGKSRETVANAVRLLNLPEEMKKSLREGKISKAHARALLAFADPTKQKSMYLTILAGGLTTREAEGLASVENGPGKPKKQKSDSRFLDLQDNLKDTLQAPVLIQTSGAGGKIIIRFATVEELTKIAKNIID